MRLRAAVIALMVAKMMASTSGLALGDDSTGVFTVRRSYGPVGTVIDVVSGTTAPFRSVFKPRLPRWAVNHSPPGPIAPGWRLDWWYGARRTAGRLPGASGLY